MEYNICRIDNKLTFQLKERNVKKNNQGGPYFRV